MCLELGTRYLNDGYPPMTIRTKEIKAMITPTQSNGCLTSLKNDTVSIAYQGELTPCMGHHSTPTLFKDDAEITIQ